MIQNYLFQGTENKVGMQQKLAAELLSKEEILGKMQVQIRELTKNIKLKYAFSLLIVPNNGILFNKF